METICGSTTNMRNLYRPLASGVGGKDRKSFRCSKPDTIPNSRAKLPIQSQRPRPTTKSVGTFITINCFIALLVRIKLNGQIPSDSHPSFFYLTRLSSSTYSSSVAGSMFSQAMKKWVQGNSDEVRPRVVQIFMKDPGGLRPSATLPMACV